MKHYNYIFTGGGLAALTTVVALAENGRLENKSVLIIDPDPKTDDDRTWCFWEKSEHRFSELAANVWSNAVFADARQARNLELSPYRYKRIKASDFYSDAKRRLQLFPNVEWRNEAVIDFSDNGNGCSVKTTTNQFTCDKIFNSIFRPHTIDYQNYPLLQQHFKGWFIKTKNRCFDARVPTFMDFSVPQKGNTRFMYVLPLTETEALVEYTLFSQNILADSEYDIAISEYLQSKSIDEYEVVETEKGSIPMTVYPFWKHNSQNLIHIGTAGGWTKASTGYTFRNTIRQSQRLADFMQHNADLRTFHKTSRFRLYDMLLLDVLDRHNDKGSTVFSSMFRKGSPALIFKFLDEQTTLAEDIAVILKCPTQLFLSAAIRRIFK